MVIITKGRFTDHLKELREELKKEPTTLSDELLREHLRKLRMAWTPNAIVTVKVA